MAISIRLFAKQANIFLPTPIPNKLHVYFNNAANIHFHKFSVNKSLFIG